MKWKKLGCIYCPVGDKSWQQSHAAVPIADYLEDDLYKIYFSSRDKHNRSYICYIIIDINYPDQIVEIGNHPVLVPGKLGCFDDSGAMATWLCTFQGQKYLYYIGWNLGVTVPFRNSIGLAMASGKGVFEKYSQGPIVDRTVKEPHFCASCCVLPDESIWRMWYLSCVGWEKKEHIVQHRYHIKYAESQGGILWQRKGKIAIDFSSPDEYAISRPTVIRDKDCWKMWYSYRGHSYRIGYAESMNGIDWVRNDHQVGIDVSATGWDSEMIEYPFVFDHKGQRYMLYNGNDYGRTGFGLAVLEDE